MTCVEESRERPLGVLFCSRRRVLWRRSSTRHYQGLCVAASAPVGVHRHCRGLNAAVCSRWMNWCADFSCIHTRTSRPACGWGGAPGVRQPLQEWCSCCTPAAARPVGWGGALGAQPLQEWCSCRAPAAARPVGWGGALGARRRVGASCAPGLRILVRARGRRVLRIAALWLSTGTTGGLIPQWCSWPSTARVVLWVPLREWCHCRAPAVARPVGYGGALGARQDAEPL